MRGLRNLVSSGIICLEDFEGKTYQEPTNFIILLGKKGNAHGFAADFGG